MLVSLGVAGTDRIDMANGNSHLDIGQSPLNWAEFGEPTKVSFIGGEQLDAQPPRAYRHQRVVGQSSLPDLLITILGRQPSQHFAGLSPIADIRHQDALHSVKTSRQSLNYAPLAVTGNSIKFFEHHRTQPQWCVGSQPPGGENSVASPTQGGNVNGSVKKSGLHLATQGSVHVFNINTALDKALCGFEHQTVLLVFRNRKVQGALDGFSLRFRVQRSLCALDLG